MLLFLFLFFLENEKLKVEKQHFLKNALQQTSTNCRLYKSNCFTKDMPSRFGSSIQGMSYFERTYVFSKTLNLYVQVSLETTDKFKNLIKK